MDKAKFFFANSEDGGHQKEVNKNLMVLFIFFRIVYKSSAENDGMEMKVLMKTILN